MDNQDNTIPDNINLNGIGQIPTEIRVEQLIEDNAHQYAQKIALNRVFPHSRDGLKSAQLAIILALAKANLKRGEFLGSAKVSSTAKDDYHPHNEDIIYKTAVDMADERAPLIEFSSDSISTTVDNSVSAPRYTSMRLTELGREMTNYLDKCPPKENYAGKANMVAHLKPRFPYSLFVGNGGIGFGMNGNTLPLNPNEVLDAMALLVKQDLQATTQELTAIIKGPDISKYTNVYMSLDALEDLIEEGSALVTLLNPLRWKSRTIEIPEVPYREKVIGLKRKFESSIGRGAEKEFKTFSVREVTTVASEGHQLSLAVTLRPGFTMDDAVKEIYNDTNLKRTYNMEYIMMDDTFDADPDSLDERTERKLTKMSVRSILEHHININYELLEDKYRQQLTAIDREEFVTNVLEKFTRPHILEWFKDTLDKKNKKDLAYTKGNEDLPEGVTEEEINVLFSANNLNRLSDRDKILAELDTFTARRQEIHAKLERDSLKNEVLNYIEWVRNYVDGARLSKVGYYKPDYTSKAAQERETKRAVRLAKREEAKQEALDKYNLNIAHAEALREDILKKHLEEFAKQTQRAEEYKAGLLYLMQMRLEGIPTEREQYDEDKNIINEEIIAPIEDELIVKEKVIRHTGASPNPSQNRLLFQQHAEAMEETAKALVSNNMDDILNTIVANNEQAPNPETTNLPTNIYITKEGFISANNDLTSIEDVTNLSQIITARLNQTLIVVSDEKLSKIPVHKIASRPQLIGLYTGEPGYRGAYIESIENGNMLFLTNTGGVKRMEPDKLLFDMRSVIGFEFDNEDEVIIAAINLPNDHDTICEVVTQFGEVKRFYPYKVAPRKRNSGFTNAFAQLHHLDRVVDARIFNALDEPNENIIEFIDSNNETHKYEIEAPKLHRRNSLKGHTTDIKRYGRLQRNKQQPGDEIEGYPINKVYLDDSGYLVTKYGDTNTINLVDIPEASNNMQINEGTIAIPYTNSIKMQ